MKIPRLAEALIIIHFHLQCITLSCSSELNFKIPYAQDIPGPSNSNVVVKVLRCPAHLRQYNDWMRSVVLSNGYPKVRIWIEVNFL